MRSITLVIAALLQVCFAAHSVLDYGDVTNSSRTTLEQENANRDAFVKAVTAANTSETDRVVLIPESLVFTMTPIDLSYLHDVEIVIDGLVLASKWHKEWPFTSGSENKMAKHINFWRFDDCLNLKISGSGMIDGQGFMWWVREFFNLNLAHRPKLISMASTKGIEISGVKIHNSPSFHIVPSDCEDIYMHDFEIVANYMGLFEPFRFFNLPAIFANRLQFPMPWFPLNTDGIDVAARNATFRNVNITNYDDAIVPKPSHGGKRVNCTEDILVENSHVHLGVGMSIGSVPPNLQHSCVRNVVFRDVKFTTPFKAIYIKTNPGDKGSGEIRNVTYENIEITNPVWWGIYIGPQQQKQPGTGRGPGCMFYPLNKTCPTQPRITISDITLRNVTSSGGLLPAGIIRCNETNPCKGFNFENVDVRSEFWDTLGQGYIVENIEGTTSNVFPDPGFGQKQPESIFDTFMKSESLKGGLKAAMVKIFLMYFGNSELASV